MRIALNKPGAAWSKLLAVIALAIALPVLDGCGCGFDCNSGNNNKGPAFLDLGFSDEDLEELKQVVIEVDKITLTRSGGENVVIDTPSTNWARLMQTVFRSTCSSIEDSTNCSS